MIEKWTPQEFVQELDILAYRKGPLRTEEFQKVFNKIIEYVDADKAKEILDWHTAKNFWIDRLSDKQIQALTKKVFDKATKITDVQLITNLVKTEGFTFTSEEVAKITPDTLKKVLEKINNSRNRSVLLNKILPLVSGEQAEAIFEWDRTKSYFTFDMNENQLKKLQNKLPVRFFKNITTENLEHLFEMVAYKDAYGTGGTYLTLSKEQIEAINPATLAKGLYDFKSYTPILTADKEIFKETLDKLLNNMTDEQAKAIFDEFSRPYSIKYISKSLLNNLAAKANSVTKQ